MGDIRSMIREILAEEIAALRGSASGAVETETVQVGSIQDLTAFALSILSRASDPAFASSLRSGALQFSPVDQPVQTVRPTPVAVQPATQPYALVTSPTVVTPEISKSLITERDIAALTDGTNRVRVGKRSRMTPLAIDEARRRSIRIERSAQ